MNTQEHAEAAAELVDEAQNLLDRDGVSFRVAHLVARAWMHAKLAVVGARVDARLSAIRVWLESKS